MNNPGEMRQVLGRVKREEFAGRAAELDRIVAHALTAEGSTADRGLLILLAPLAGVSELLRQAYDRIFHRQENVVPVYFALPATETTAVSVAIEFLNTFLLQYIACRRNEPALADAPLTLNDMAALAPAADVDWIEQLVAAYNQQRFSDDDRALVRFCLSAPSRVPDHGGRPFVMFDCVQLSAYDDDAVPLATEIVRTLVSFDLPYVFAGLRREVAYTFDRAGINASSLETIRLERLTADDASTLISSMARRLDVTVNEETRDLLIQQLEGSPLFITALLQAARSKHVALNSYLACERLYVEELMGGTLGNYFASALYRVTSDSDIRGAIVRLLSESATSKVGGASPTVSFKTWCQRLKLDAIEVEKILRRLHTQELVNWDGNTVDGEGGPEAWKDYLRSRFRLDALREPRALVFADLMAAALKRAPEKIARHFRQGANLRIREMLSRFSSQRVPRLLFDSAEFSDVHKGGTADEIVAALDADTDLVRLPQVFHTTSGVSFSPELRQFSDEENCAIAHAFDGATYTDANEVVWMVAKIESKLAAGLDLTRLWLDRLEAVANRRIFLRIQIWLIANEGFDEQAYNLLKARGAYASSQQQFELLSARLSEGEGPAAHAGDPDEFEFVLPMSSDSELLAANTAEQIARRAQFTPEAINQIKTAIVEACINASEHSLSPDRKIYQRFRVEDDKLVITIASRGIVPSNIENRNTAAAVFESVQPSAGLGLDSGEEYGDAAEQRRGWGLKLIQTLMDEVEFERVDEGTSLRMVKYLRKG
ncbi:MAG TPA: ATP-binding protein [Pyrinomonadaceae bacterium]|nr:ATP-binding protein [Pyrinomonadaceae bacterium]